METQHEPTAEDPNVCVPTCARCAELVKETEADFEEHKDEYRAGSLGGEGQNMHRQVASLREEVLAMKRETARLRDSVDKLVKLVDALAKPVSP